MVTLFQQLRELKLEVTYRCPLACIHCSSDGRPDQTLQIDPSRSRSILEDAAEMGVREVAFSGGEPLVWPNIVESVACASELGMEVTVYTTGNAPGHEELFAQLAERGLSRAVFSLYSADPVAHERITRRRGSHATTCEAIRGASSKGVRAELHFVALARTYRSLPDVVDLASDLGATRVSVLRFVPQGRGALLESDVLTRLQALELKQSIQALRDAGGDLRTGSPWNYLGVNPDPVCPAAQDRIVVGPDLRIYPCDAFKQAQAEELVGSVAKSSLDAASLGECWQESPFLNAVREVLSQLPVEPCLSCDTHALCQSGCLAQRVIAVGAIECGPDPGCVIA